MSFQEKSIQCADCGATFAFTVARAGVLRIQGLHQRAEALSFVPPGQEDGSQWDRKRQLRQRGAPADVLGNVCGVWQGRPGAIRAPRRQTGLLQRLLQQSQSDQVIPA